MVQQDDHFRSGRGAGPGDVQTNAPGTPLATSVGYTPTRNQMILFWASFLTLIAGGIGFAVRAGILVDWGKQFGFTQFDLGNITGAGLWGFPIAIIPLSFIADRVGYKPLMVLAFLLHASSAVVTLAASYVYTAYGHDAAYQCLYWGTFIFSLANGACESVINPLTATLFPRAKTHWLNILHAGWPGGLILGALILLSASRSTSSATSLGNRYGDLPCPHSDLRCDDAAANLPALGDKAAGIPFANDAVGIRLADFALPPPAARDGRLRGTRHRELDHQHHHYHPDEQNIRHFATSLVLDPDVRTAFPHGPIVHKISPLGLLFCSAVLGCVGLVMLGMGPNVMWFCVLAVTVYGCGKTFFWPTMLGVISERFPKGGALTLGIAGGIGMLSAGLLGAPASVTNRIRSPFRAYKDGRPHAYDRYKVGRRRDNSCSSPRFKGWTTPSWPRSTR